jgi:type III pantothenate kinase
VEVAVLLVLDVGNTTITVGAYGPGGLQGPWRLGTRRERSGDEYGLLLRGLLAGEGIPPEAVTGLAVSCVVPPVRPAVAEMSRRVFGLDPLFVEPGIRTGLPILTDQPQEVGADRIVNAVSALARHGGPAIVVDFGTATTFDALSSRGEYLGGAIAPGVGIAAEALFERAAKLPRVELTLPPQVIGRNTVASMQAGLMFGYAALVDGIVHRMAGELAPPDGQGVTVLATGGHASALAGACRTLQHVEPDLTLDGLRRLWERNCSGAARC